MAQTQKREDELTEDIPLALRQAEAVRAKGRPDEAFRMVNEYLDENFDDIVGLMAAAHITYEAGKIGLAQALLRRAAALDRDSPEKFPRRTATIWNNLGLCYQEGASWEEGEACFFRALKCEPNDALAHNNLAQVYLNTGQPQLALKHTERALAIDPDQASANYNAALANLMLGNWKEGWQKFDAGLQPEGSTQWAARKERVYGPIPRWTGVEGKTIIAYGEQGLGDEISFSSCVPDLMKKNTVILECDKRLVGLFKRSFGVETHGTRHDETLYWLNDKERRGALRKFDASVALGSLPQFYRNKDMDFPRTPYLVADPQRRLQWRALLDSLGPKMKVGIAWTGGNKNTGKHRRSLDLDDLIPILQQDATFVSLQYKPAPEIEQLERSRGIKINHWPHALHTNDYDDTAALVAELDLVISVTTAVIHLSGALGVPCWVMTPKAPRWFYGLDSVMLPWYRSIRLYRQHNAWLNTIAEVATDLRTLIIHKGQENVR